MKKRPILIIVGVLIVIVVVIAIVKRDTVADLILRGGDTTLVDESARNSPHAKIALDFLAALRANDKDAMIKLTTPEQTARIERETRQPTEDFQKMRSMMLGDLPADQAQLRSRLKTVQIHKDRAVVLFETKANSWFVQLAAVGGAWKVSDF